jgi:neutral ceramidase
MNPSLFLFFSGRKQHDFAMKLYASASTPLTPNSLDYRMSFLDMKHLTVTLKDGSTVVTCGSALGYAFAAGTTDGPYVL